MIFLRLFLILPMLTLMLYAKNVLQPTILLEANNNVISSFVQNNTLYLATDNGSIEIYSLSNNSKVNFIELEKIMDGFSDDLISPRVSHIDVINDNNILLVSDDSEAGKALHLYKDGKITKLFTYKDRLNISKAYFFDENRIVIGLLGNEMLFYDLNKKEIIYKVHPYWSMLTDFILNQDRTKAFIGAESGNVYIYEVENGKKLKEFELHTDIILNLDFANNTLITGGSDRKITVTNWGSEKSYSIASNFIVSTVGVSPSGNLGAYVAYEDNTIIIFNTTTKQIVATLIGSQKYVNVNNILFLDEKEILVSYNNKKILKWKLQ